MIKELIAKIFETDNITQIKDDYIIIYGKIYTRILTLTIHNNSIFAVKGDCFYPDLLKLQEGINELSKIIEKS